MIPSLCDLHILHWIGAWLTINNKPLPGEKMKETDTWMSSNNFTAALVCKSWSFDDSLETWAPSGHRTSEFCEETMVCYCPDLWPATLFFLFPTCTLHSPLEVTERALKHHILWVACVNFQNRLSSPAIGFLIICIFVITLIIQGTMVILISLPRGKIQKDHTCLSFPLTQRHAYWV